MVIIYYLYCFFCKEEIIFDKFRFNMISIYQNCIILTNLTNGSKNWGCKYFLAHTVNYK